MWHLEFLKEGPESATHLLCGKVYSVGRRDTDIIISNDSSVSRKHCSIQVMSLKQQCLVINDTSKYGTFCARNVDHGASKENLQFEKVEGSAELNANDIVRVGVLKSMFQVVKNPLVVVASKFDSASLKDLRNTVNKLGGKVVTSWSNDVTHLCMKSIVLNVKVTQALATNCYIVTEAYFSSLVNAVESKLNNLPHPKDFVPKLAEEELNEKDCSFLPVSSRRHLFNNKIFVFMSNKQRKRLGETCIFAGGTAILVNDPTFNENMLITAKTIIVYSSDWMESQLISSNQFDTVQNKLTQNKLRFIQEHEIGLALVYCSVEAYCNPSFDLPSAETLSQCCLPGPSLSQANNDEIPQMPDKVVESLFVSRVPETVVDEMTETTSLDSLCGGKKRHHSDCDDSDSPPKKIAINVNKNADGKSTHDSVAENVGVSASNSVAKSSTYTSDQRCAIDTHANDKSFDCKKVTIPKTIIRSNNAAVLEFHEEAWEDLPDSCISDDSLWTSSNVGNAHVKNSKVCDSVSHSSVTMCNIKVKDELQKSTDLIMNQNSLSCENHHANVASSNKRDVYPVATGDCCDTDKEKSKHALLPEKNSVFVKSEFGLNTSLPSTNCTNVVFINLIKQQKSLTRGQIIHQDGIKNFKRFQKVMPTYLSCGSQTGVSDSVKAPTIIGGRDLYVHENRIEPSYVFDNWINVQSQSSLHQSQDSNPFSVSKK